MYNSFFKPVLDFFAALILLLILFPLILLIAILLFVIYRRNPFFLQQRPGKNAAVFYLIKFRTMADRFDQLGNPLPDKERITKLGRIIRAASLDEILQLVNVLKGDMSLIGPRPLLVKYLPLYSREQARRHEVKPGITGWAQVNGRNSLSWKEKFKLDVWYVDNISFLLDVSILFKTIQKVFKRDGIDASSQHTMVPFNGNN